MRAITERPLAAVLALAELHDFSLVDREDDWLELRAPVRFIAEGLCL
jgi:hypothetical protein